MNFGRYCESTRSNSTSATFGIERGELSVNSILAIIPSAWNHVMSSSLVTFGISLAALAIWLVVQIINRRERWAKWTMLHAELKLNRR